MVSLSKFWVKYYIGVRFRGLTEMTPFSCRYLEVLGQKISCHLFCTPSPSTQCFYCTWKMWQPLQIFAKYHKPMSISILHRGSQPRDWSRPAANGPMGGRLWEIKGDPYLLQCRDIRGEILVLILDGNSYGNLDGNLVTWNMLRTCEDKQVFFLK